MGRRFALYWAASGLVLLTACLPTGGGGGGGGGGSCSSDFQKSVDPDEIQGNRVFVSMDKLDFMFESGFVLEDVDLQADLQGNHQVTESLDLSMNGTKMSRNDGHPTCDSMIAHADKNQSESHFKLQKFSLNGGLPFDLFMLTLKLQHGRLELRLNGKGNVVIADAQVVFKGKNSTCPPPPPPPVDPKPAAKTTITGATPSTSPTSSTNMSISFSADQTGVTFWCSLDGSVAAKCTSPQSYTGVANGAHVFKVYSQNSSGVNETPPAEYDWTVDSVAPTVTITNSAQLPTLTNQTAISFQLASNEPGTFKCSLDGAAYQTCVSPQSYAGVSEGQHDFAAQAVDTVGNLSGTPAHFVWTVDVSAPVLTMVSVSPYDLISKDNSRRFEFAASETVNYQCAVDNGAPQACSSPVQLTGLSEGNHWFEVYATDLAGNAAAPISVSWKNDYTPPQLTTGTVTPAQGLTNSPNISVEFGSSEPGTIYCSQDGDAAVACTSPLSWTGLADGAHSLSVYAVDIAGNVGATTSLSWTIDTTAPVLSFTSISPSSASYLNVNSVTFDVSDSEAATISATLNGSVIAFSDPLLLSGLSDGSYSLLLTASDAAGNVSASLSHDFVIDTVAPQVTLAADDGKDPTNLDIRHFTFTASEDVTYMCNMDGAGYAACVTPYVVSGLADGPHTLWVQASDLAGNVGSAQATWSVDTHAPTTTLTASVQGTSVTLSFNADETATFECALDGGSLSAGCTSPMTYSGLSAGTHSFVVWATDVAGNRDNAGASTSFFIQQPISTSITSYSPTASLSNQNTAQFAFTASQTASAYMCSLDGAAYVACSSPVSYSGLADGAHSFNVKAVDIWGTPDTVGASRSWTVDTTPPVVNSFSTTATTNSITVTWTTSEASTDQVRYGVGFTINQQTGESSTYTTTHSIKLTGLSSNTTYSVEVYGRDQAGNAYLSSSHSVKTSR
jgi:hypothetical protein